MTTDATHTVGAWIEAIRRETPAGHPLELAFDGCRVRILASKDALCRALADYFSPFVAPTPAVRTDITVTLHEGPPPLAGAAFTVKPPDAGKTKIKEEYIDLADGRAVRKRLTGMVFLFTADAHLAAGPCQENLNQVVNFINNRFIQWKLCRGGLLGHASAVAFGGKGLAIAGFSGAGKSTLALELMRNPDCVFISNDRLMVEQTPHGLAMTGVAKLPRINPGTALHHPDLGSVLPPSDRERFSRLPPSELWDLEHKFDVFIETCFGPGRFALSARMAGLVLLNWQRTGAPLETRRVDLHRRRDLLSAFMKQTGLFFWRTADCRMPDPDEAAYIDLLGGCPAWELSGGADFRAAASFCRKLLEGSRGNGSG